MDLFGETERTEPWWDVTDNKMNERIRWFNRSSGGSWPADLPTLEKFERDRQVFLDQGNMLYETLVELKIPEVCPKCGQKRKDGRPPFHVHYLSATDARAYCPQHAGEREHVHVGCNKCGYHFPAKVAKPIEDDSSQAWFGHSPPLPALP